MYYVNAKNLIQVERADKDFMLMGVHPVKAGEIVATDETGFQYVIEDEHFYQDYLAVRKLRHTRKPRKSPFELAYAEQLANFSLENNVEDNDYIEGTKTLISNKSF
jgi:hypothetical protein